MEESLVHDEFNNSMAYMQKVGVPPTTEESPTGHYKLAHASSDFQNRTPQPKALNFNLQATS